AGLRCAAVASCERGLEMRTKHLALLTILSLCTALPGAIPPASSRERTDHDQRQSQALPDELSGVAGGPQSECAAESEQHSQGGGRRIQRSWQGAYLRVSENAER